MTPAPLDLREPSCPSGAGSHATRPGRHPRRRLRERLGRRLTLGLVVAGLLAAPLAPAVAVDGTETQPPSSGQGWLAPGSVWNGDFADPTVVRDGSTYYAYATMTGGRYLPVLTSTDLVTWRAHPAWSTAGPPGTAGYSVRNDQAIPAEIRASSLSDWDAFNENDALVRPAQWAMVTGNGPWITHDYWAPGVFSIGSTWYAYSAVKVAPERYCLTVATAASPLGPFRDTTTGPIQCQSLADDPGGSIDPFPYHDPASGKDYLLWKALGKVNSHPSSLLAVQLGSDGLPLPGAVPVKLASTNEGGWEGFTIENPSMVDYHGVTYLFYSANYWGTSDDAGHSAYATGYAVCPQGPTGPCNRVSNVPLLSSSGTAQGPGGSSAFIDASGNLRLTYATNFLGENRVGDALRHPRRMGIATLTQCADATLNVVAGTGPVGPASHAAPPAPRPTPAPAALAPTPAPRPSTATAPVPKTPAAEPRAPKARARVSAPRRSSRHRAPHPR